MPNYDQIFEGDRPITQQEFENWHKKAVLEIIFKQPHLSVGWASHILNHFLHTAVVKAGLGRPDLPKLIHPLLENMSLKNLKEIISYHEYQGLIERTKNQPYTPLRKEGLCHNVNMN